MTVKDAIERGDAAALREMLGRDARLADELIVWGEGKNQTHPLHYVSDMLFGGVLQKGLELPLVEALIEAGADVNHTAANGETPLIGAASLHAEEVGLRLLEAGARVEGRSVFGASALHWAAHEGLCRLVEALVAAGADLEMRDERYEGTPLDWAKHGTSAEAVALLESR